MRELKSLTFVINHICFSITSIAIIFPLKGLDQNKKEHNNAEKLYFLGLAKKKRKLQGTFSPIFPPPKKMKNDSLKINHDKLFGFSQLVQRTGEYLNFSRPSSSLHCFTRKIPIFYKQSICFTLNILIYNLCLPVYYLFSVAKKNENKRFVRNKFNFRFVFQKFFKSMLLEDFNLWFFFTRSLF